MSSWTPRATGDPSADGWVALHQAEAWASERIDPQTWDYVRGGAGDEVTLRDNINSWSRHRLRPHVMTDVSSLDTSINLFGARLAHPIVIAPTASHARYHPEGEIATLRGAAAAEAITTVSTLASLPVDEIGTRATELGTPWWMQVYLQRERSLTYDLLDRAVAGGASALVLTVDTPSLGARDRDKRNPFGAPTGIEFPNVPAHTVHPDPTPAHRRIWNPHLANNVTGADITALHDRYAIPVLAKGILRADDARRAIDAGASGIIVSNHGGRNLDTAPATADVLADIVAAAQGHVPVLVDGGIRRGTDIATALCLGASAVLIGRPIIWGLSTYGSAGVTHAIDILRTELEMAMALLGAENVAALGPDLH
jgi:isopentenyl diphosphate isomerase/L-lactate dehydrogenase-like FMN-dependent dehydrogenase